MSNQFKIFALLFTIFFIVTSCNSIKNNTLSPYNLRCEYLQNPLGIENPTPALSWKLSSPNDNDNQTAFRILASSSKSNLEINVGELWDTKKISTNKNLFITYSGKQLSSGDKVFYKVRVWDSQDNPSEWSEINSWEMGLINNVDWLAKWIGTNEDQFPDSFKTEPAPYFRKEFYLKENI
ncbi:MAG: hypothetical protein ACC656_08325, partial [Candidatus Heimdallarchaeota archaeon]